jgi:hypothetical protein
MKESVCPKAPHVYTYCKLGDKKATCKHCGKERGKLKHYCFQFFLNGKPYYVPCWSVGDTEELALRRIFEDEKTEPYFRLWGPAILGKVLSVKCIEEEKK